MEKFSEIEYYIQTENSGAIGFYPNTYVKTACKDFAGRTQ